LGHGLLTLANILVYSSTSQFISPLHGGVLVKYRHWILTLISICMGITVGLLLIRVQSYHQKLFAILALWSACLPNIILKVTPITYTVGSLWGPIVALASGPCIIYFLSSIIILIDLKSKSSLYELFIGGCCSLAIIGLAHHHLPLLAYNFFSTGQEFMISPIIINLSFHVLGNDKYYKHLNSRRKKKPLKASKNPFLKINLSQSITVIVIGMIAYNFFNLSQLRTSKSSGNPSKLKKRFSLKFPSFHIFSSFVSKWLILMRSFMDRSTFLFLVKSQLCSPLPHRNIRCSIGLNH